MRSYLKSAITALAIAMLLLVICVGVVAPHLSGIVGSADASANRQFTAAAAKRLELVNADGSVRIRAVETDDIRFSVDIKLFARTDEARASAAAYLEGLVQTEQTDEVVRVVTEPDPRPNDLELRVVYSIDIPVGVDIDIDCVNGNVFVGSGAGDVTVRGRNADILVQGPLGDVVAQSVNGRIGVYDAPESASLATVNGNVNAQMRGGFLEATTDNGLIVARLLDPGVRGCDLTSRNGGIRVELHEKSAAAIDARTTRGSVTSDLDIDTTGGVLQRRRVEGRVGGDVPKAQLKMDTSNGNIRIVRATR